MMMAEEQDLSTLTGSEGYDSLCSLSEVTNYFNADLTSQALKYGWVFWRDQHSDFGIVEEKIMKVLKHIGSNLYRENHLMVQFWAAKEEGQHHYLTTLDQPFCLGSLGKGLCWYRKLCMDASKDDQQLGPVGRVYRNKQPESSPNLRLYSATEFPLRDDAARCGLRYYLALPVFDMYNHGEFYGVLELLLSESYASVNRAYVSLSKGLEKVPMLRSTHLYQPPNYTENEITKMLEFAITAVPQLHLAQVSVPCKQCDHKRENFICMQRDIYKFNSGGVINKDLYEYLAACELHNLQIGKEISGCFHKKVCDTSILENPLAHYQQKARLSLCFTVPLVSVHNINDISVVEFFLHPNHSQYASADSLMQFLILIMEKELKGFKFSLGGQFAEKLQVESSQSYLIENGCCELNMLKEMEEYEERLSESDFKAHFPLTVLSCVQPSGNQHGWAIHSPDKEESSHVPNLIKTKIKLFMSEIASKMYMGSYTLVQFWAPKMENGRRYLATSEQPYALDSLCKGLARFRKQCMEHHYIIDDEAKEEELGPPGRVFRNGCPEISNDLRLYSMRDFSLRNYAARCALRIYMALPVFDLGHHNCVGVLEFLSRDSVEEIEDYVESMYNFLKVASLDSTHIISQPDSSMIICREQALDEFEEAFQLINEIPQLYIVEIWIPYDRCALSCMELAFISPILSGPMRRVPHVQTERGIAGMVLASESKCCFCQHSCALSKAGQHFEQVNRLDVCFAICLQSSHTGNLPYVVQFYLNQGPTTHEYLKSFLKFLLPIMKQKLKSFKVASGKQLGEELVVEVICFSDTDKLSFPELHWQADTFSVKFKPVHFDQKSHQHAQHISDDNEPVESGRHAREHNDASENSGREDETKKTEKGKENTSLQLNIEDLEPHFGRRLDDVAKELDVGRSTIKRVLRKNGIPRWPNNKKYKKNPSLLMKEKASEIARGSLQNMQPSSSSNRPTLDMPPQQNVPQTNTGSTQSLNSQAEAEQVIVKVKYKKDTIQFQLYLSSGIEKIVEEVARRLHLEKGSFKLKYVDVDNDKILLTCDDDLQFCPKSVTATGKACIRLFVELNL